MPPDGMTPAARVEACRPAGMVIQGDHPDVLSLISEPDVALAVWKRPPGTMAALGRWLDALPVRHLPDGQFVARLGEVPEQLSRLCEIAKCGASRERDRLIDDITRLARLFARATGRDEMNLRIEAIDHDSCWRFHRDHVGLRLNATYLGPGTQFVPAERAGAALRAQRSYRGQLRHLRRFDVGLFKGKNLAGDDAIVHRSPPIVGSGLTRLFLCINEATED